jgi:hypothetical protein
MDLNEISNLIEIRNYIASAINNYALERNVVAQLNKMLILLDRRIVERVLDNDFKKFLGYEDVEKFLAEARKISDIKSSFKK